MNESLRDNARAEAVDIEREADDLWHLLRNQHEQPLDTQMIAVYRRRAANIAEALARLDAAINQMEPE